jgi:hypothetical protein
VTSPTIRSTQVSAARAPRRRPARVRFICAAAALAATLLSQAACDNSSDSGRPPSTTTTPSAITPSTQTPTPTKPVAPALPASAKGLTVESADAFTRFYLQLLDYAKMTRDVTQVKAFTEKGCVGCGQIISGYEKERYTGDFEYMKFQSVSARVNENKTKAQVRFTATVGRHTVQPVPSGTRTIYPGETIHWRLTLQARRKQWIAFELIDEKG